MFRTLRSVVVVLALLTGITGVVYPALVTLLAQGMFPHQANGSLVETPAGVVGSELIGQSFTDERYFWGRPSATSPTPFNATASTGSNLGPTNPAQFEAVKARVKSLNNVGDEERHAPIDLVTASGSGLDPNISPAAAEFQSPRVAKARGVSVAEIRRAVAENTAGRTFGLLGEPRVNVLRLNLAIDRLNSPAAK